ncbi:tRNA preQ1(34) S-adenosylmethionine ribosyltransferase-isomerase QueA [Candidatus Gracilibacteria bacterium]|nr:tRNA preQ1(34) S-adenosylmethionine ribosyltransferase-isomerase QueA [Candidatus Gracilibacteria bacterium]
MKLSDFDYALPERLIAQKPLEKRDHSRLLVLDKNSGDIQDKHFYDIVDILNPGDVLVVNKTRVINARLKGVIDRSGVACEIFLHKQMGVNSWDCMVYPGRRLKPGTTVTISDNLNCEIVGLTEYGKEVVFDKQGIEFLDIINKVGQTPLPPYIKEKLDDSNRYQTVYSQVEGSIAAPTAGLHFTSELIEKAKKKGIIIEEVMLHIGLGTFRNVEQEDITNHPMHSEQIILEKDVAERLNSYKQSKQNIIAVGTTSVRVLESFSNDEGILDHGQKDTEIFIYPGYNWKFVDNLITNFHLPKSTLIMLVSSLAGQTNIKKAYQHGVDQEYRFFSFGDSMLIK